MTESFNYRYVKYPEREELEYVIQKKSKFLGIIPYWKEDHRTRTQKEADIYVEQAINQ